MDLGLDGKVAMVAGGSAGLGLAVARELAREGARVAICGRDPDRLAAAEAELGAASPRGAALASRVDLARPGAGAAWVREVVDRLGAPGIAVTNASGPPFGPASWFAPEDYRRAIEGTMMPAVELALAVLPHMRAAGWGRILLITSETVATPVSRLALSGVARVGLVRFAQSLAAEVGREGVTVNVLAPGVTRTPGLERAAERLAAGGDAEAELLRMGEGNALGRPARPEEFGAVAAFLASRQASFVTGTVQLVDGGAGVAGHEHGYLRAADRNTYP